MAKRRMSEDAKLSAVTGTGTGNIPNAIPIAPDTHHGKTVSASQGRKEWRDNDPSDEARDNQEVLVATAEQAEPESTVTPSEQPVLVAQTETAPTQSSATVEAVEKPAPSNSGWWWLGGIGLAAGGTSLGFVLSGDDDKATSNTVSGTVTDGPVQGARVWFDVNGNGTYDAGTDTPVLDATGNQVVTDALGHFSFTTNLNPAGIKLVTSGGTDTVTGETVAISLSAPAGYSQFNPITSAIAAYLEANPGATTAQAEAAVETALGLPDLDYSSINLAAPPANLASADILKAQQVAAILATAAIVIDQAGTHTDAFQFLAANLGSGGNTSTLVAAVQNDPSVSQSVADQLTDTVAAVNAANSLDAIDAALNTTFYSDNASPIIGDYTVSLAENSSNGTAVQTVTATDANNDTISYSITAGNERGAFAIDAASGAITVADASKLDFETTTSFSLTVQASDGSLTDTGTVTVNISDLNDNTPVITSGGSGSVAENAATSTVIYNAAATDADAGTSITYSLKAGGDAALLNIDPVTGAVTLKSSADFETKSSYDFTVIASDGTNSSEQAVTVGVTDLNDNTPVITSGASGSMAENAATSTVIYDAAATDADAGTSITYSLTAGRDAALLNIDSATGAVTLKSSADFETKSSYDFTVIASDGTNSSEQAVTVGVTDLNDNTPVITSGASGSVAENAATSTVIYDAAATDADAGTSITYSLMAGGDAALLNIDSATGAVTLKSSADFETKSSYDFTVIASDGTNSSEQAVTVGVTDLNDNTPVITSGASGSVAENSATSTVIYDAAATDADAGSTITYSLKPQGPDYSLINIDSATGEVRLNSTPDYETRSSYTFTVIASDGTHSSEQVVTVGVTDIHESFVVEKNGAWIDENGNGVRDIEDTTAADFTPGTGNVDLSALPGVIHFNNMPSSALNLAGFGTDDLIEIDVQAFIGNGHNALNMLDIAGVKTLDQFKTTGGNAAFSASSIWNTYLGSSFSCVSNSHRQISSASLQVGTQYRNINSYPVRSASTLAASIALELRHNFAFTQQTLRFKTSAGSSSASMQLTGLPTDMSLQAMVDFVNPPVAPTTIHVVVDRDGPVIDYDNDGVRDRGENRMATFGSGGNADLTGATPVVIHFNDAPSQALDLTGFGADDKIEFDVSSLQGSNANIVNPTAAAAGLYHFNAVNSSNLVGYTFARVSGPSSSPPISSNRIVVHQANTGMRTDFNGNVHSGVFGIAFSSINASIGSRSNGLIAYWTDSSNALNSKANLLPDLVTTPSSNQAAVLANLNANHYTGMVEFVWPVHVVVDDEAGNVATFIDTNANGVRDAGENTLALIGQTQADVDAFNVATAATGIFHNSQTVDLASEQVTIHYNDLPAGAWTPDLTGFSSNDRLEIDVNALRADNDTVPLSNQNTQAMSSPTQIYAGVSGISISNAAIFISGGNLNFGHRTMFASSSNHYVATAPTEGIIAGNADIVANNFQQVVFVT